MLQRDRLEHEGAPHLGLIALTARFLRFGLLAWGGPVAQIAMLRHSLVDEERWVSSDRFNRTMAVYQVLPGPEAQELCIYFGTLSRGRIGGFLAGLAFMLPGFLTMLVLTWFYVQVGVESPIFAAAFAGAQAAVLALIVRGVQRIGSRALHGWWLPAIAAMAFGLSAVGVHFAIALGLGGLAYALATRGRRALALATLAVAVIVGAGVGIQSEASDNGDLSTSGPSAGRLPSSGQLFVTGIEAGGLTFGGAYTAIPFVQDDAVRSGRWMTNEQFLDGLALSGTIPAPLIIFATFVGYIGAGLPGAVAITVGIFLPAFAITLVGHNYLEAAVRNERLHAILDGITAGVVGLVAFTTIQLALTTFRDVPSVLTFAGAAIVLYTWQAGVAVPVVVIASGVLGVLVAQL